MSVLLVACGGAIGAAMRFMTDARVTSFVAARWPQVPVPVGTGVVNVVGSFLLGVLTGAGAHTDLPHAVVVGVGVGLLGGFTTFSTARVDVVVLAHKDHPRARIRAGGYAVGMLVLALTAGVCGWMLAGS